LNDFCFTTGAFDFPPHLVTILKTTAQLEINTSNRSCVTNATYQTGAQSKISVKNVTLSQRSQGSVLMPHTGAVTNVDFKLCCSLEDSHKVWRKVESSSSEAKIVPIGAKSLKIFPSRLEKGTDGLSFFALEGKIEQRI